MICVLLQSPERFIWEDGSQLTYHNWKQIPMNDRKRNVIKESCVSHFQTPNIYSDPYIQTRVSNCDTRLHQFTNNITRRNHPIRSSMFNCTALILNDMHHEEIITIPCNEVILVNNELMTLVCQSEIDTNNSRKATAEEGMILATSLQTQVCKLGYVYIMQRCYKLIAKMLSGNQESRVIETCHSEGGDVSSIGDIKHSSGDNNDVILMYVLHWLHAYTFPLTVADVSGDEEVNIHVIYGHHTQPFSVRQINVSESSIDGGQHMNVLCAADSKARTVFCNQGMFQCKDKSCILDQFLCDGHPDCGQSEDESDCSIVMLTTNCSLPRVLCLSGECIHPGMYCDGKPDCSDGLDEFSCAVERVYTIRDIGNMPNYHSDILYEDYMGAKGSYSGMESVCTLENLAPCPLSPNNCYPKHEICVYDRLGDGTIRHCTDGGHLGFDHCPRHECPGLFKCANAYCVLLHMLCDGELDCPSGEDEGGCASLKLLPCPGMLRCRDESHCVHPHYYNDRVAQCPLYKDDEKVLDTMTCPKSCICVTSSFVCDGVYIKDIPSWVNNQSLHVLSLRRTQFELKSDIFNDLVNLQVLVLSSNRYTTIPDRIFEKVQTLNQLDLSSNRLDEIQRQLFIPLKMLIPLDLSGNLLTKMEFSAYCNPDDMSSMIMNLNLANNYIGHVTNDACALPNLVSLNLTSNPIQYIHIDGNWTGNISSDIPNICCFIDTGCPEIKVSVFSTCGDMLGGSAAKSTAWILTIASFTFNSFVFYWWLRHKVGSEISRLQIRLLSLSDILICVYSVLILVVDVSFRGKFPMFEIEWKQSAFCAVLGSLITFAYLTLIYTKFIIALDRFILIRKTVSRLGFAKSTNLKLFVIGAALITFLSCIHAIVKHTMMATRDASGTCMPFLFMNTNEFTFWYHILSIYLPLLMMNLGTFLSNVFVILKSESGISNFLKVGNVVNDKRHLRLRILKWKCLITLILDSMLCLFTLTVEVYMRVSMSELMMKRLYAVACVGFVTGQPTN